MYIFLILDHSLIIIYSLLAMLEAINSSCFRFESELFNWVISDSRRTPFIKLPVVGMLRTIAGMLQGQKCIKMWSSFLSFNIFALMNYFRFFQIPWNVDIGIISPWTWIYQNMLVCFLSQGQFYNEISWHKMHLCDCY